MMWLRDQLVTEGSDYLIDSVDDQMTKFAEQISDEYDIKIEHMTE